MFNQKNEIKTIIQGANILNMLYLSYHYYTNPESLLTENGFSFVCSLINFYSLGENKDIITSLFGQYMSAMSMGGIVVSNLNNISQLPALANFLQLVLLNPANIAVSLYGVIDEKDEVSNEVKNM